MKNPKPIFVFALLLLLAFGCKAVFVFAPAKQKTINIELNRKDTTRTQNGTQRTQTGATHTQIKIEQ